jgi:hypothetical protein
MKIVQSHWSKPGFAKNNSEYADYNKCGWWDKKYNYFSWALSCLQLRKYYDRVELVTDQHGYELLINKLGLPYTTTQVKLDELDHYNPGLWAIGKLYAYGLQKEPFIHVDSDVYIWEQLGAGATLPPLLCQCPESTDNNSAFYQGIYKEMLQYFKFIPELFKDSISRNGRIRAINAGIIGGADIDFFTEFVDRALHFVNSNEGCFDLVNVSKSNIVFEQFLFHALAESKNKSINYLSEEEPIFNHRSVDFTGVPSNNKYIHMCAGNKRITFMLQNLEGRLLLDHPEYYFRIMRLMKENKI